MKTLDKEILCTFDNPTTYSQYVFYTDGTFGAVGKPTRSEFRIEGETVFVRHRDSITGKFEEWQSHTLDDKDERNLTERIARHLIEANLVFKMLKG